MEALSYSILSSSSLYLMIKIHQRIMSKKEEIFDLRNLPILSPSSLQSYMESGNSLSKPLLIEGIASTAYSISGYLSKRSSLLYQMLTTEKIYSNERIIETPLLPEIRRSDKVSSRAAPVMELHDIDAPNCSMKVHQFSKSNVNDSMSFIGSRPIFKRLGMIDKGLVVLSFIIEFLLSICNLENKFKGVVIGLKKTEWGIRQGTYVLIYGKAVYDQLTSSFKMKSPKHILVDKERLVDKCKSHLAKLRIINFILAMIFGLSFMLLYKRLKKAVIRRLDSWKKAKIDKLRSLKHLITDDLMCSICATNPRSIIFKPCLHFSICHECSERIEENCPFCRKRILEKIEVFVV